MRARSHIQRFVLALLLVAPACQSPDGERALEHVSVVEQAPPDAVPAVLTAYLADSSRAGGYPRVLGVWGPTRSRYAVAAWHPHPDGYSEHRLSVLDVLSDSVAVRSQDVGVGDAHWDSVRVFTVGTETYIVGAIEDEYALGLRVLRVDSAGSVVDTRFPELALPDTSEFVTGPSLSALEAARVDVRQGRLVLEFSQELIVDPGGREQAMLCPLTAGAPIVFQLSDGGWNTVNGARYPASEMINAMLTCAARAAR